MGKKILDVISEVVSLRQFLVLFDIEILEDSDGTFRGCCPIHGGDNPSAFAAYKNPVGRYSWVCHTKNCHNEYGGNMVGLVSGIKKCTSKKAIYLITKKLGIERDSKGNVSSIDKGRTIKTEIVPQKPEIHNLVDDFFLKTSYKRRFATDFFSKNNISEKIVEKFGLGYNVLENRITIPIWDENNRLVGWSSRYIDDNYINTVDINGFLITKYKISLGLKKRHLLYGLNLYRKLKWLDYIVLVEGFRDVFLLYSLGIIAVSVFGHTLSPYQLYLLKKNTKNVIICFDNDGGLKNNPGQKGSKKVQKILIKNGLNVKNICPPLGLDIGDAFINKKMYTWVKENLIVIKNHLLGIKNG